ncbi:MAG: hypothetical protein EOM07_11545, partial [Clostridia bacterium]|nr:hypothetical protein [Clostridia bacterium]
MDEFPAHAFKKGTQVQVGLDSENMLTAEVIEVDEADKTRLEGDYLALLFNKMISYEDIPPQGFIELTESTVIKDVQMGAIENITEGKARADYMDRLFSKPQSMGFKDKDLSEVMDKLKKKKYPPNESQREAIAGGIRSNDAFFVMGPPGTGKTTVILEWVKYFVLEENKRVLISSQNNKAVDNVLERLREEEGIDLIRIGSEAKLQSEIVPFILENKIKTLQKRITENCSGSIKEITALMEKGPLLLEKERALFEAYRDFCDVEKRISEKVKEEYLPLYSSLSEILYRYQQTALKSSVHYLAYEKLRSRRNHLKEKKENVFRNLYGSFLGMREKIEIKRYNRFIPKLTATAEEYNSLRGEHYEALQKLYQEEGKAYYEARILYEMKKREIRSFEESLQNAYDLFHTTQFEEDLHRSEASFQQLKEEIEGEIERGQSIAEILGEWKEENETKSSYALQEMVLQSANVVGATCIGVSSQKKFQDILFDVTIIDEAGQIQIHNALVPMSVSEKLIMLGDHKQIPPIVDEEVAQGCEDNSITTEYLEKSLFEILYDKMPEKNKMMLDTQYRMPKEIADLISEEFYHGAYQSPDFKAGSTGVLEGISDKPLVLIDTSEDFNRFDEQLEGEGYRNSWEAKIVRDVAKHLKDLDMDPSEIGIISAYKSQVAAMKKAMRTLYREDRLHEMVATLDSFQGQERDVIIYSFTFAIIAPSRGV